MEFPPGTLIGPYEVKELLGRGGMGEIYRCRDSRLGRDVAVKLLPTFLASDPERDRRLELEARAVGQLQHPNILAVFDTGVHANQRYMVTELLEGANLREALDLGQMPLRKVLSIGLSIAQGLAAAHEKGIVHRDIKPENVFILRDGQIKLLDFGLAKWASPPEHTGAMAVSAATDAGMILGTVAYMSPEQAEGGTVDARSDIFSFGSLLYEMLSGRQPFSGSSPLDVMYAISRHPPVSLEETAPQVAQEVVKLVERCMAKDPNQRFQSMRDLALTLDLLSGSGFRSQTAHLSPAPRATIRPRGRRIAGIGLGVLALAGILYWGLANRAVLTPTYRQISFHRGTVYTARFTPDGETILYSAEWEGALRELYATVPGATDSRALGVTGTDLAFINLSGEATVLRRTRPEFAAPGTLARLPLTGGLAKDLVEGVNWADGSIDGKKLMVVRRSKGSQALECPPGKVLYQSTGELSYPRFSPSGKQIAFLETADQGNGPGSVVLMESSGAHRTLAGPFPSLEGMAWRNDREIWFTASTGGHILWLRATDLRGHQRVVCQAPGRLVLHDISRDGKVVAERNAYRGSIHGFALGGKRERELAWMDFSNLVQVSRDGRSIIFNETGEAVASKSTVFVRGMDGSPPVRLGEGKAVGLSEDGSHALVVSDEPQPHLEIMPIGAGHSIPLPAGPVITWAWACFLPGGEQILFEGTAQGHAPQLFLQDISGGPPRPASEEGVRIGGSCISPDGRLLAAQLRGHPVLLPLDGSIPRPLPGLPEGFLPISWSRDGQTLFVRDQERNPAKVFTYDLRTHTRKLWKEIHPLDPAGILYVGHISFAEDGKAMAYQTYRLLSDLYVIENLR